MTLRMLSVGLATPFLLLLAVACAAEPLPKSAKPMTSGEVRALHADRTARGGVDSCTDGDTALVKWFADGRVRGISSVPSRGLDHIWWGKWWVAGSSMCMRITKQYFRNGRQASEFRCWNFYKSGSGVYAIMSSCPTRTYGPNDYFRFHRLSRGDLTAPTYEQLNKKYVRK